MIGIYLLSFNLALIAFVWVAILTQPSHIFGWFPGLVYRITKYWKAGPVIRKLLYECELCISGQLALWGYLVHVFSTIEAYNPYHHIICIFFAIFIAGILNAIWQKINT
jgi:hypothetical protein